MQMPNDKMSKDIRQMPMNKMSKDIRQMPMDKMSKDKCLLTKCLKTNAY